MEVDEEGKDREGPGEQGSGFDDGSGVTFEVVEEEVSNGVKSPRKGVYLLPNLITTCALFWGFYSIIASLKGLQDPQFLAPAAFSIYVAMVFDALDGRVARLTNTSSAFGEQYDSLSDAVSFGVAPAVLAFTWGLNELGKLGWVLAFVYMACGILRLARFNVQIGVVDSKYFIGLPSPAAAALIAGMVWFAVDVRASGTLLYWVGGFITLYAGLMMVSNARFSSFKGLDFKGRVPFRFVPAFVLLLGVVLWNPPLVLFLLFFGYSVSGLVDIFKRIIR